MKLITASILLASSVAGFIAVQNPPPANSPQTIFVIAHSEKTTTVNVQVPTIRAEMEYQYFANLPGVSVALRQNVNLIDSLNSYASPRFIEYQDENPCTYVGDGFWGMPPGHPPGIPTREIPFLLTPKERTDNSTLLQISYQSEEFTIRKDILDRFVDRTGDVILLVMTRKRGLVEVRGVQAYNYPSTHELPKSVAFHFPRVIDAINRRLAEKNSEPGVFLEYFWDMRECVYCLETHHLFKLESVKELGVFWYDQRVPNHTGVQLYLTRLRITPNSKRFQQEMMLEVNERADFYLVRFYSRSDWTGNDQCEAAKTYIAEQSKRRAAEIRTLSELTGWPAEMIQALKVPQGNAPKNE
jgi:hypothetical protein